MLLNLSEIALGPLDWDYYIAHGIAHDSCFCTMLLIFPKNTDGVDRVNIMILWLYPCLLLIGNFDVWLSMKSLFCSFVRLNGMIIGMLFFF